MRHLHGMATVLIAAWSFSTNAAYVPGAAFDRFITIWLENQDFTKVVKNADIRTLTDSGVLLTSYYGLTHPSQPNYIASVAGDYFGLDSDGSVSVPENVSTLVDLFAPSGIQWREYMEDIPSPGFTGVSAGGSKSNFPLISFGSVVSNTSRAGGVVGLDAFTRDLNGKNLPQYAFISPNIDNDGHDTGLAYGASWLRKFLTPLLQNSYFMDRTLVLLTYDESETYSQPNKIGAILLGGPISDDLKGSRDDTFYTHYSILSTLENNWGLLNLGRYDVGANVFKVVANKTGYHNQDIDRSRISLNKSYPGALNSGEQIPIPAPNPYLTGAGGKGVVQSLPTAWLMPVGDKVNTPYDGSGNVFDGEASPPVYRDQGSGGQIGSTGQKRSGATTFAWPPFLGLLVLLLAMSTLITIYG